MPQDEIEVPESLKSAETYEFIGFDKKTALEIWSRFISTSDPDDPEGDFMGYARSYVNHSGVPDALSVLDDWTSTMNRLGINKTLQSAIMLPEFDDLRSTASCKFWVLDSMTVAYATLEHLNDQLRSEMARRQRISKTGHRDKSQPPARPAPRWRDDSASLRLAIEISHSHRQDPLQSLENNLFQDRVQEMPTLPLPDFLFPKKKPGLFQ